MAQSPLLDTRRHTRGTCSDTCVQFSQGQRRRRRACVRPHPLCPHSPHGVGTEIRPAPASRTSGWGLFQVAVPGSTEIETSAGALQMFVERVYEKNPVFQDDGKHVGRRDTGRSAARPDLLGPETLRTVSCLQQQTPFDWRWRNIPSSRYLTLNRESSGGGRRERGRAPLLYGGDWSQGTAA